MIQARLGFFRAGLFIELGLFPPLHQELSAAFMIFQGLASGEDFACKAKDARLRVVPGFPRQTRFAARFFEKLLARESMFDSNLRQEQTSLRVEHD